MKTSGQVAVEFLTTYGWMLIITAGVIGALVYFGFADVRDSIPTRCDFTFDFTCGATFSNDEGSFAVQLKNSQAEVVNITRTICEFPFSESRIQNEYADGIAGTGIIVRPGEDVLLDCDPTLLGASTTVNGKQLYGIKVIYEYNESGALPQIANGEIVTETVDGPLPATYTTAFTTSTTSVLP